MPRLTSVIPAQQAAPMTIGFPPVRISFTMSLFKPIAAIAMTMKNFDRFLSGTNTSVLTPACTQTVVITEAKTKYRINTGNALRRLKARDGVVSILGNHDYCPYIIRSDSAMSPEEGKAEVIAREKAMGWRLLMNEHWVLHHGDDSIAIVGVENTSTSPHFPKRGDLYKAMHGTEGMFHILLSHDPTHWDMGVIGKDIPLTLSGHTHAMQFSLLGWSPIGHFYKQSKGLYRKGNQQLYINIGLGETIFPARVGATPEITRIVLKSGKKQD